MIIQAFVDGWNVISIFILWVNAAIMSLLSNFFPFALDIGLKLMLSWSYPLAEQLSFLTAVSDQLIKFCTMDS